METTLAELAARTGAALEGDGRRVIRGVAGVRDAGPDEVAFVSLPKYAADAAETKAAGLFLARDWDKPVPCPILRVDKPEESFYIAAKLFAGTVPAPVPGVHPSAVVSADATVGPGCSIGPLCVVEAGAVLGGRVILQAGVYIGHGVRVGDDCHFYPGVSIREHCQIGSRVILHNGAVIGSDGFGYSVNKQGVRTKIPQIGIVVIGDDVEIGANSTIDRARFGKTKIGDGVKIDNLVQIAHNVIIGDHAVIVAQVGIAGSTIVGSKAVLAGQSGVAGHLVIGEGAIIGAQAGVTKDVKPGSFVIDFPATPQREAAVQHANVARLPELKARVADLEKRIRQLESRGS